MHIQAVIRDAHLLDLFADFNATYDLYCAPCAAEVDTLVDIKLRTARDRPAMLLAYFAVFEVKFGEQLARGALNSPKIARKAIMSVVANGAAAHELT